MKYDKLLALILVLQGLILADLWVGGPTSTAQAQVPDSGAQRLEIIETLKDTNAKLDNLISILQSGKLQVVVAKPDEIGKK